MFSKVFTSDRGFTRAEFKDRDSNQCSIQESSVASGPYIWLGINGSRMLLDQAQAAALWPALKSFAETGKLEVL